MQLLATTALLYYRNTLTLATYSARLKPHQLSNECLICAARNSPRRVLSCNPKLVTTTRAHAKHTRRVYTRQREKKEGSSSSSSATTQAARGGGGSSTTQTRTEAAVILARSRRIYIARFMAADFYDRSKERARACRACLLLSFFSLLSFYIPLSFLQRASALLTREERRAAAARNNFPCAVNRGNIRVRERERERESRVEWRV